MNPTKNARPPGRLILWPGLAADERMYQGLWAVGLERELLCPRLLVPQVGECWPDYARRTATQWQISPADLIGGCSFGSLLATQIACRQPVQGLVLLAGALSSTALSPAAPWLQRLAVPLPLALVRSLLASKPFLRALFGPARPEQLALARQMLNDTPDDLLRRGGALAVSSFPPGRPGCPVVALHGDADRVLRPPPAPVQLELVAGAGHGLVVSHEALVRDFLQRQLRRFIAG
ncbi:MAG: hypothetical protein M0O99_04300 [Desulfuromonas thiophila]|nr:hypothetical protein [Desulfuromonas thiophila]